MKTFGIRWRIVITYMVLIVLALSIFGVYMMQFIESLYMNNLQTYVRQETTMLADWMSPHLTPANVASGLLEWTPEERRRVVDMMEKTSAESGARVTLIDRQGHVLLDTMQDAESQKNQLSYPEVAAAEKGEVGNQVRTAAYSDFNVLELAVPVYDDHNQQVAVLRLAVPLKEAHDTLQSLWGKIGLSLLIVAAVASLFGLRFAHGIAAPIEAITSSTKKIAAGAFDVRIRHSGRDELKVMADSINAMAERISQQLEDVTQEKGKLEGILSHLVSGVLVIDRSGRITLVNPAAAQLFGLPIEQLLGKWHWEAGHHFGLSSLIDEALLVGKKQKKEINLYKPLERTVEVHITPIPSNYGRIAGAVVLMHDVSEWRRLERMRSEFVANVSHELRTPITAVKGFSETLLDGAMNDPDVTRQFLQIINDESARLTRLVTDLLELSKIESGHTVFRLAETDLVQLAKRTVKRYQHQAEKQGLTLLLDLPERPVELFIDADRISQVLINLLGNAMTYTSQGGQVTVAVRDADKEAVLEVRDTGIGIPPEDLPRLFERFYRVDKARARRSGGTGLGLAIVKHIVEGHHGSVEVQSAVGKGSAFYVHLPKRSPEENHPTLG